MSYPVLTFVALGVIAIATLPTLRGARWRPIVVTLAVLVALTAIFDNVIVGLDIVGYDDSLLAGLRVPYAPIEDFAYAVGAVVIVPALWRLFARLAPAPKEADDAA